MGDRRKEFAAKANELQTTKKELEEKGNELAAGSNNGIEEDETIEYPVEEMGAENNSTPVDRRAEYAQKTQQLTQMNLAFQERGKHLLRKEDAGIDGQGFNGSQSAEPRQIIGKEGIKKFDEILQEYRDGKANLDERIRNNQNWWKLRHYGAMSPKEGTTSTKDSGQKDEKRPRSVTAWTVNAIINKHADYMDNYPEATCLPVEEQDVEYAKKLSYVLPAIHERANYEQTYSDVSWYKLIAGTGVTGYFWDSSLLNGLGDISIEKCDILNLFWEPGSTRIQDSEYFFNTKLLPNEKIRNMYPDIEELKNLRDANINITRYDFDDKVDTPDMSLVVDVYYHRLNSNGKSVLHYCKYVGDVLLFASENEDRYAETGYYKHGKYPFVFDTMFPVEGSPCGFGYIDIVKEPQKDIDELTDDFMHNAKSGAHRRYIVNRGSGINVKQLADVTQEIIESDQNLDDGKFKELITDPLDGIYMSLYTERINEIKEVSNNRDVSSGGSVSGVTAASAIAAMQEAGSKTSRDQETSAYRAFKEGCYLVIELIAENYDEARYFRITGNNGNQEFISFNNNGIKESVTTDAEGNETSRKPIFDIKVKPQKRSTYSTLAQNELMKELWGMGIFDPQTATQSAMLIEFMEFEGKDKLLQQVSQNGTIYQQLMQYQQIVLTLTQQLDALNGGNMTEQVQMAIQQGQVPMMGGMGMPSVSTIPNRQITSADTNGNNLVDKAREESRARNEVR